MAKAKTVQPTVVTNRSAAIRNSKRYQADDVTPDERDVQAKPTEAEVVTSDLQIDLKRPVDPAKMTSLEQQVLALKIVDTDSHAQMLNFLKAAKMMYRIADDSWKAVTRRIDAMKDDIMKLAAKDRVPLKAIIDLAETRCNEWTRAEEDRVRRENDDRRRRQELEAQAQRDRELAEAEAAALALEEGSPKLSVRELTFVEHFFIHGDATQAAKRAQYQDPAKAGAKLLATTKIADALDIKRQALAQREQAEAVRQQPLKMAPITTAVAQTAKVAGVQQRKYFKCEVVDVEKLNAAYVAGQVPLQTFTPDTSYLDKQASALKDDFEAAFPGCRLVVTDRIAG